MKRRHEKQTPGAYDSTRAKMNREHRVSMIHLTRGHRVLARHAPANVTVSLGTAVSTDVAQRATSLKRG